LYDKSGAFAPSRERRPRREPRGAVLFILEWSKVVVVNVLLVAIGLVLLDFALRLTSLDAARETGGHPDGYYVADHELGATLARNFPSSRFALHGARQEVFTNELGCFDWAVRFEPNEPYIIAIGDSFTWGHAPLEKKWTSIIERETSIRVLKCGIPATGSEHQLRFLKRLVAELPHPPALVIQLHDTTDFNATSVSRVSRFWRVSGYRLFAASG
jgi:hypothetical protein